MSLLPASQLTPQIIDWLWPKRLPAGNLALLDGHPGLGKSWVMLDLCARISTGRPFPDGSPSPGPANCLIINGDNPRESVVLPRLIQLGADLEHIFIAPAYRNPGAYRWPKQRPTWAKHLRDHRPVLTIVDPLFAFLASTTAYVDERLRAVLVPLRDLAEEFGTVMLMTRHVAKMGSGPAVTLGLGSMALSASCPTIWLAARDPANPDRCILAESKNNYGPGLQPSLSYSLVKQASGHRSQESGHRSQESGIRSQESGANAPSPPSGERAAARGDDVQGDCKLKIDHCKLQIADSHAPSPSDGKVPGNANTPSPADGERAGVRGDEQPPRDFITAPTSDACLLTPDTCLLTPDSCPLTWHGVSDWTAEQLGSRAGAAATYLEEAKQFLNSYLAAGPRRARDLWNAARQLGLARTTVLRAKGKLHIRHTRALTPTGWTGYWLLPGQEVPEAERLPSPPNLEPWLKPLREKYGRGER